MIDAGLGLRFRWANSIGCACFTLAFLTATHVGASPFELYGVGAKGAALAGAMSAQRADYAATHYNPAGLTGADGPQVGFGVDLIAPNFSITGSGTNERASFTKHLPESITNFHVGALFPLGARIGNRFAVGVLMSTPLKGMTRVEIFDRSEPHLYRFDSQPESLAFGVGLAMRVFDWLSAGIGVHSVASLSGGSVIEVDLATRRFVRDELESQIAPSKAFVAGLNFHPAPSFAASLSYRQELALTYDLSVRALISEVGYFDTAVLGESLYQPERLTFGTSWAFMSAGRLMVDLVWERWSQAPDPGGIFLGELDGRGLDLGSAAFADNQLELSASDTLTPRIGAEWSLGPAWLLRAGYAFLPTPLPVQSETQNFADSDVHQIGLGASWTFANPWASGQGPLAIEMSGQLGVLEKRGMIKRDEANPVGSYDIDGQTWYLGLTLRQDVR